MGKLKDLQLSVEKDGERLRFTTPVSVNMDGMFTTTLPKDAVSALEEYGIDLERNRLGNAGFFQAETLAELENKLKAVAKDALSRELVDEKLVIKYQIRTKANYVVDRDNEIIPNGLWMKGRKPGERLIAEWREGNYAGYMDGVTPGISLYARVFMKKTFSYKSGKRVSTYEFYCPKDCRGTSVDWINSLCRIRCEGAFDEKKSLPEVDATEENAALFVELFKFIFKANELLKGLEKPEAVAEIAASMMKALPRFDAED